MYGGGWLGKNVVVIKTMYGGIEDILSPSPTPEHLVGLIGKVSHVDDERYDAERPTGYERIVLTVRTPEGEFEVDSAC